MNAQQATDAVKAIPYPRGERTPRKDQAERVKAYRREIAKIETLFKEWLEEEYASDLPERIYGYLWAKAWEEGHAHGYHDVENQYIDYADFAQIILLRD